MMLTSGKIRSKTRNKHRRIRSHRIMKSRKLSLAINEDNVTELEIDKQQDVWERYLGNLFKDDRNLQE